MRLGVAVVRLGCGAIVVGACLVAWPRVAEAAPRAGLVDQGERVHGELDVGRLDLGETARIEVLRGEYAAVQVAVEVDLPLRDLRLELGRPSGPAATRLELDAFVEHYVRVRARSRNASIADSLAFTDAARPSGRGDVGLVPDALVPVALARPWVGPNGHVPSGERRAFWVEAFVPPDAPEGPTSVPLRVVHAQGTIAELTVVIDVLPHALPYQAARFFAYYERATLERRFDDPDLVEKQLWQRLHAHHLDAVTMLLEPSDVERIAGALDGRWFDAREGYRGPGARRPPEVVVYGAYGLLGAPSAGALTRVERLERATRRHHPGGLRLVYAVDEQCESPHGPAWRRLLEGRPDLDLRVVHTCHEDPRTQDVDVIMQPGQAFALGPAMAARAQGKHVFVYNGQLPHAPPMMLDAPATAPTLAGWIAAGFDVERWYLWETIFWDDGNRGGLGPRDPFADPETFHNADGDVALLDGLLFYPGRAHAEGASSLGVDEVLPSLRLKRYRRGIEDAGLLSIASHRIGAERTASAVRSLVGAAFDEADPDEASRLVFDPKRQAALRDQIRRAATHASGRRGEVDEGLVLLRQAVARRGPVRAPSMPLVGVALPLALFGFGLVAARLLSRRPR